MSAIDAADLFTPEEFWMLYGLVVTEVRDRDRAARMAMADCGAGPWRSLQAKLRLQIERAAPKSAADPTPDREKD